MPPPVASTALMPLPQVHAIAPAADLMILARLGMFSDHDEIVSAYEAGDLTRTLAALRKHNATGRRIAAETLARLGGSA